MSTRGSCFWIVSLLLLASSTAAQVHPSQFRSGTVREQAGSGATLFTAPSDSLFVLTDFHWSLLAPYNSLSHGQSGASTVELVSNGPPARWERLVQFLGEHDTNDGVTAFVLNEAIDQHWNTGLVFGPGQSVRVLTGWGFGGAWTPTPDWIANWSGYVVAQSIVTAATSETRVGSLELNPNPSTSETRFAFSLSKSTSVVLSIFDVQGRRVRRLHEGILRAGPHAFTWDGMSDDGAQAAAGVYFAVMSGVDGAEVRKLTRIR
jgi:hypothetical protein